MLQVALGLLFRERRIIDHLYEYKVCASYDEVRRYKISAASHATSNSKESMFAESGSRSGLIQGISDNFDASLSTQNGMKQTHALATIITQHGGKNESKLAIPRLKKEELSSVKIEEVELKVHTGSKKPTMDKRFGLQEVLPLKVLCQQVISVNRCKEEDFDFIQAALSSDDTPDFNGFNTEKMRRSNQDIKPKSEVRYRPLINKTPSDPSTMLTAMTDVEKKTEEAGQHQTVFTADQQLYRVCLDIIWSNPQRWMNFVPRLGGMHWLMSFVGSVGKLMEGSGLDKLMGAAFAGVSKMLVGKKFPMNVRALRLVCMEILRGYITDSKEELESFYQEISRKSVTAEHWINNLIQPVMLMMMYCRAEREGDFALHLYACAKMIPYFFSAGHWNYARDSIAYLNSMSKLNPSVLDAFLRGEHVERHRIGLWNAIWSDMMIESSYMNKGKGPGGLIGITTSQRSAAVWANSHHACSEVLRQLHEMRPTFSENEATYHKEESQGRIKSDAEDRQKIRKFLKNCIHPFEFNEKSSSLFFNIYTGETVGGKCNVNKSVDIGVQQMNQFKESLPLGFRNKLSTKVVTMAQITKTDKDVNVEVCNTEVIFSRVIYLLSLNKLDLETLFNYELSPVVTSLVNDAGDPRYSTTKSVLQKKLKMEVSSRGIQTEATIIDGGGMLHAKIYWPTEGTVNDLIKGVWSYVKGIAEYSTVYLVFDRYKDYSIKSDTRQKRIGQIRRSYTLTLNGPLPPKEVCLASNETKECLIELISEEVIAAAAKCESINVLVTSKSDTPTQSTNGVTLSRDDMTTNFDEADYIIPQQVDTAINEGCKRITVLSADTDVFVLLCHSVTSTTKKIGMQKCICKTSLMKQKQYASTQLCRNTNQLFHLC